MKTLFLDDLETGEMHGSIIRGSLDYVLEKLRKEGYMPKILETFQVYITVDHKPFITPAIYMNNLTRKLNAILYPHRKESDCYELRSCPSL